MPTLAISLRGEGVSYLVDEPVSQIIERPWGAGLKSVPRIVVQGMLYDSPPLSLGSSRSRMASPNMFRLHTVIVRARPGKRARCGACSMY